LPRFSRPPCHPGPGRSPVYAACAIRRLKGEPADKSGSAAGFLRHVVGGLAKPRDGRSFRGNLQPAAKFGYGYVGLKVQGRSWTGPLFATSATIRAPAYCVVWRLYRVYRAPFEVGLGICNERSREEGRTR